MPLLKRADADPIAQIINAYWIGVSKVLPEPFEQDPGDFVIQKGQGTVGPSPGAAAGHRGHPVAR
jgi:hypothetical protein